MEQIPRSVIDSTTRMLNSVSDECRGRLRDALMRIDYTQDVATIRAQAVALMEGYCGLASDTAASIAAQFYDGIREMELGEAMGALAESGREPAATEGAVRAFADKLADGDVEGFVAACLDRLDYELKVAASQTVLLNARRDPRKPRFARVPAGGETCRFCLMLSGRGFAYRNEAAASHAHANCDCRVVPSWGGGVEGYDPDAIDAQWRKLMEKDAKARAERNGTTEAEERAKAIAQLEESAKRSKAAKSEERRAARRKAAEQRRLDAAARRVHQEEERDSLEKPKTERQRLVEQARAAVPNQARVMGISTEEAMRRFELLVGSNTDAQLRQYIRRYGK